MSDEKKPSTIEQLTRTRHDLEAHLNTLLWPGQFRELLDLAEDIYLFRSLEDAPAQNTELSPTRELVSSIGLRGLKAAVELSEGIIFTEEHKTKDYESEDKRPITLDTTFRTPQYFSEPANPEIIDQITHFGEALLTEAFSTLGKDAHSKVESFRNATTVQEQLNVLAWLDQRLTIIARVGDLDQPSEELELPRLYHPARLSPKLIGEYPHNQLAPTCLGVSIIAASFFRRAHAPTLHADVAMSTHEFANLSALVLVDGIKKAFHKKFPITTPEPISSTLDERAEAIIQYINRDEAHHSTIYVKLLDGSWAQFDSNYNKTTLIINPNANKMLDKSHRNLNELKDDAPGLELSLLLPGTVANAEIAETIIEEFDPSLLTEIVISTYAELLNNDVESLAQRIYENCVKPFFTERSTNPKILNKHLKYMRREKIINPNGYKEQHLQTAFYKVYEKYFLWGDSPEYVLNRCENDPHYIRERAFDGAYLPILMLTSIALYDAEHGSTSDTHTFVEVGLPETRIGLAVLSDLAAYTDSSLPASFWLTHWPGNVSVYENLDGASHSSWEDSLIYNNLIYRNVHPLTSRRNQGIINAFVGLRHQKEETNATDSARQAGEGDEGRRTGRPESEEAREGE